MELNQKKGSLIIILRHKRVSLESMPRVIKLYSSWIKIANILQLFNGVAMFSIFIPGFKTRLEKKPGGPKDKPNFWRKILK